MEKTKAFYLVVVLAVSALLMCAVNAQAVSEDARRHMARGQAAVEMAKSPAELEDAMREFQNAAELAPNWPDPYYNLGLAQEKSGKLSEAIASFQKYLRLAPNAPDAAKIQEQIYKLEYKAEQVLSIPEIIDVLVSFWSSDQWQKEGKCRLNNDLKDLSFEREGNDAVKVVQADLRGPSREIYQTLKVTGPVMKYITTLNLCSAGVLIEFGSCDNVVEHEVEVVSKRLVKANQKVLREFHPVYGRTGEKFSCTAKKK